jgi:hypothetical protein
MFDVRLCGDGYCKIPIGPIVHWLIAYKSFHVGKVYYWRAVVVVLVAVWLAAIWLMFIDPQALSAIWRWAL